MQGDTGTTENGRSALPCAQPLPKQHDALGQDKEEKHADGDPHATIVSAESSSHETPDPNPVLWQIYERNRWAYLGSEQRQASLLPMRSYLFWATVS